MEVVSMSRVKFVIMSLLAALAISGVAASSAMAAHEWLRNGAPLPETLHVLSEGGLFLLEASGKEVDCKTLHDLADILKGSKTLALWIHFLECGTNQTGCLAHSPGSSNGLILVLNVPDLLVLVTNSNNETVLADEFKQNETTKEFVTLEFTADSGGSCTNYPKTQVKGNVSAEVNNSKELLNFPKPELVGNTLEAFGTTASLYGDDTQMFSNGGKLTAL
jgi:hypothetical protein